MKTNADKPNLKSCVREWIKTVKNNGHFYVVENGEDAHINCKCPLTRSQEGTGHYLQQGVYSGVTFIWFGDGAVFSRPDGFWMAAGPVKVVSISNPKCFDIAEEKLHKLHEFFINERFTPVIKSGGQ